ncbi:hypothetical protein AcidC75_30900 [Acidisoma sp. C75]
MVEREVNLALDSSIQIVPFRIEDVKPDGGLAFYIGTMHWLDALTHPVEAHLARLVDVVKRNLPNNPTPTQPSDRSDYKESSESVGQSQPEASGPPPNRFGRQSKLIAAGMGLCLIVGGCSIYFIEGSGTKSRAPAAVAPLPPVVVASPPPGNTAAEVSKKKEGKLPAILGTSVAQPPSAAPTEAAPLPPVTVSPKASAPETTLEQAQAQETALGLNYRQRRAVQQGLTYNGVYSGPLDGVFGPSTRASIKEYQHKKGLPETGFLDGGLLSKLTVNAVEIQRSENRRVAPETVVPTSSTASPAAARVSAPNQVQCVLANGAQLKMDLSTCRNEGGLVVQ